MESVIPRLKVLCGGQATEWWVYSIIPVRDLSVFTASFLRRRIVRA